MSLWSTKSSPNEEHNAVQVLRRLILGCHTPPLLWPAPCEHCVAKAAFMFLSRVPACRNGKREFQGLGVSHGNAWLSRISLKMGSSQTIRAYSGPLSHSQVPKSMLYSDFKTHLSPPQRAVCGLKFRSGTRIVRHDTSLF